MGGYPSSKLRDTLLLSIACMPWCRACDTSNRPHPLSVNMSPIFLKIWEKLWERARVRSSVRSSVCIRGSVYLHAYGFLCIPPAVEGKRNYKYLWVLVGAKRPSRGGGGEGGITLPHQGLIIIVVVIVIIIIIIIIIIIMIIIIIIILSQNIGGLVIQATPHLTCYFLWGGGIYPLSPRNRHPCVVLYCVHLLMQNY